MIARIGTPAAPVLADMLNARIQYVHARPHGQSPMIETGVITEVIEHRGLLYITVQPDNPRLITKQRPETDFLRYIHVGGVS